MNLPIYSKGELSLRNGQDKEEIWVAYKGKIYDLTSSKKWVGGKHYNIHWSGQDLTSELQSAPHTELVFSRFPVVGILKE